MTLTARIIVVAALCALTGAVRAEPVARTVCVYDPGGEHGDAFNLMQDYRNAALGWGVKFTLKPYIDDKTAVEDFKAGKCNAALLTGVRTRAFNRFTASIEAMGGIRDYQQLKAVIVNLASPKAASLMRSGDYETAAVVPGGAVFLLVRDRSVKSIGDLAGKRVATLEFDDAAKTLVRQAGASMVVADIGTFAGMFNNGGVAACYAPATAFAPLELSKGLGRKGGVIRYPLAQLTMQLVLRHADFPEGFGLKSRAYAAKEFARMLRLIQKAEKSIPSRYWIEVPAADQDRYDAMFRDVRIRLRDQKVFDGRALRLLRRIRCQANGARAECAEKRE